MTDIKIITFPGINREKDMADAFEAVGANRPEFVWHKETDIGKADLIVLPGGFSYGDYLRCGAMAAHSPIMKDVIERAQKGTPVFAVCNGFQMLMETRLLPGALLRNKDLRFICKNVYLKCENSASKFSADLDKTALMHVPVAHGEGNYFTDEDTLKALNDNGQIAFRYCNYHGDLTDEANPNGSIANIAGITSEDGKILGMMPHPENATNADHGGTDGLSLFKGILNALQ
jgi:phosphoribosylformylglycinamidine synthase